MPPQQCDPPPQLAPLEILGNGELSCCVADAIQHLRQGWSALAAKVFAPTLAETLWIYGWQGYDPTKPETDNGMDPVAAMARWLADGINGDKPTAGGRISVDQLSLECARYYLGGAMLCFQLPRGFDPARPDWSDLATAPDPDGGHAVNLVGYRPPNYGAQDPGAAIVETWGERVAIPWPYVATRCVLALGFVDPDVLLVDGKTAWGLDVAGMQASLEVLEGGA